jgi:hypothetical protein
MGSFISRPPIERRHTLAEKPSRQIARRELGSAVTINAKGQGRTLGESMR